MTREATGAVRELEGALGAETVRSSAADITRVLRDQSWLSPVLQETIARRTEADGPVLGVEAVVTPRTEADVVRTAAIAARHRIPLTARGAGTSNFGLITPEHGGLIIDFRRLAGTPVIEGEVVRAPAGTLQGQVERAARAAGRELPVLTTTYGAATIAGWIAGGHVGLGSSTHGAVWDDLVRAVRLVTIEETPRVMILAGSDVVPVLHTFGAVGLVTEITFRTVPVREWTEAVAFFPSFAEASAFATALSRDRRFRHRVAAAQEEALMPGLTGLAPILRPGSGVLMILDSEQVTEVGTLATAHGGTLVEWQPWTIGEAQRGQKPSIATMVYGHRMLWVKRLLPEAAFIHVYFDPGDPEAGARLLKERYGDEVLLEMKFIRSPWMLRVLGHDPTGTLPAAVVAVRDGTTPGKVDEVLAFCDRAGLRYQNSHTNVIEDNGLFPDIEPIRALKAEADPHNLLARGRLRTARQVP